jgi:hypothetical protein
MPKRSYFVRAFWDAEAKVYYSESDIDGLHIEADSLDDFEATMLELAPELIASNHMGDVDFTKLGAGGLAGVIPTIVWQRPTDPIAA